MEKGGIFMDHSVHHFGDETLRATNCDNNERPQSHLAYLQAI